MQFFINAILLTHKTMLSSRLCTPPAPIRILWPHRMLTLSQSLTRKRVYCGWLGLCWLSSSSSASSSPFSSSRGKDSIMEEGRCKTWFNKWLWLMREGAMEFKRDRVKDSMFFWIRDKKNNYKVSLCLQGQQILYWDLLVFGSSVYSTKNIKIFLGNEYMFY